jgi:uncharacterized protein with FMN-binding domain
MKKILKVVLIVIGMFTLIIGGGMFYITRGLESGKTIAVNAVNATTLGDGDYVGEYKAGRWSNEIKVTIKNGKINDIQIIKDVTFNKPEWTKELFERVIEKQSTDVDIISGATVTSKAYMKAIEDALVN